MSIKIQPYAFAKNKSSKKDISFKGEKWNEIKDAFKLTPEDKEVINDSQKIIKGKIEDVAKKTLELAKKSAKELTGSEASEHIKNSLSEAKEACKAIIKNIKK